MPWRDLTISGGTTSTGLVVGAQAEGVDYGLVSICGNDTASGALTEGILLTGGAITVLSDGVTNAATVSGGGYARSSSKGGPQRIKKNIPEAGCFHNNQRKKVIMKKTFVFALFAFVAAMCCAAETPAKAPDPTADFKTYASGEKAIYWSRKSGSKEYVPYGKVEIADGKVTIIGAGAKETGIGFFRSHKLPKYRIEPGDIVKVSFAASGNGQIFFSLAGYLASGQHYYTYRKGFELAAEPKVVSHEFHLNKGCVQIVPSVYVTGNDTATVSDFKLEILSAEL